MDNRRLRIYAIDRQRFFNWFTKDINDMSQERAIKELTNILARYDYLGPQTCPYDQEEQKNWKIVAFQYNIMYHSIDVLIQSENFELIQELQLIPRYNAK